MGHPNIEHNYHVLISLELNKRKKKLTISDYLSVKPEVEKDVHEFYNHLNEADFGFHTIRLGEIVRSSLRI